MFSLFILGKGSTRFHVSSRPSASSWRVEVSTASRYPESAQFTRNHVGPMNWDGAVTELREVSPPFFATREHVEALYADGEASFGMEDLTADWREEQLALIASGQPSERSPREARVFEIHEECGYCGDLIVTQGEDAFLEVSVLIFIPCRRKGLSERALQQACRTLQGEGAVGVEALVRDGNRLASSLVKVLERNGFAHEEDFDDGNALYRCSFALGAA